MLYNILISQGNGWVGVHAAGLTGRQFIAPETPYWNWFEKYDGGYYLFTTSCQTNRENNCGG